MSHTGHKLTDTIIIDTIREADCHTLLKDSCLACSTHIFWEIIYIGKGKAVTSLNDKETTLSQGDVLFLKPGQQGLLRICSESAAVINRISFTCQSSEMSYFENKILHANQNQKRLIFQITSEYTAFVNTEHLPAKETFSIGARQLLRQYICELLISFLRNSAPHLSKSPLSKNSDSSYLADLLSGYMEDNITSTIHIDDLIRYSGSNKTTITNTFKKEFGIGAIEYFIYLKINQAKELLGKDTYSITQIAEILGYSSIHYFSRQFKKVTGMSPTEYLHSEHK